MKELTGEHAFVHENMGAYLAGGLEAAERGRFDGHIHTCPECFDAFSEARDADRALQRTLGELVPREAEGPGGRLEERLTAGVRAATTSWWRQPGRTGVRRAAYATAAAVALAATGVFANVVMRQEGRFNNPLTEALAADADGKDSDWGRRNQALTGMFVKDRAATSTVAANLRGITQSTSVYAGDGTLYPVLRPQMGKSSQDWVDGRRVISPADTGKTMAMRYENASVDSILMDMSRNFDFIVVKNVTLGQRVSIQVPNPVHAQDAVDLLNSTLMPLGYGVMQTLSTDDPATAKTIIRVASVLEMKKAQIPVIEGQDPAKYAMNDTLITAVIPVKNINATALRNDLLPMMSSDADVNVNVAGNAIVLTDTSAKIHRLAEIVQKIDNAAPGFGSPMIASGRGGVAAGGFWVNGGSEDPGKPATASGNWNVAMMPAGGASHEVDDKLGVADAQPGRQPGAPAQSIGNFFLAYNDGDKKALDVKDLADASGIVLGRQLNRGNVSEGEAGKFSFGAGVSSNDGPVKSSTGGLTMNNENTFNKLTPDAPRVPGSAVAAASESNLGTTGEIHALTIDSPQNLADGQALKPLSLVNSLDIKSYRSPEANGPTTDGTLVAVATTQVATPSGSRPVGAATTAPSPAASDAIQALKIIRNGTIEFEVRSFDEAYQHITEIARLERGYVSSTSSEKLANGHVRGTIVVRVPPERLDEFLISLRSLGDLKAQQIGAADVTKQYYDIESQLRGLTTMETRLLDLIKNGKGEVKDLIEAETKLGETRVSIERLKGEISYYNNLVSLATITITAYEKDIASPTAASEQENVNVNVETEEVEAKYAAARKIFDDAKGRIVESQLKNTDAEHVAANIVADVPPAQADFVANQLKQLGLVASFNRDRRQTTTGGTGTPGVEVEKKDTRFTVELFNLANLLPRETTVLRVAVKDVEASYKSLLGLVKMPPIIAAPTGAVPIDEAVPVAGAGGAGAGRPTGASAPLAGRVMASNLTGQLPEQMSADVRAEVRTENADALLAALRGSGEVLTSQLNTNQDNANTTAAKRGLQVTLVNMASVSPKEADSINIAVRDVDGAYRSALALIRKAAPLPEAAAGQVPGITLLPATAGRVISSGLNGQQPVQMSADIRAEIRADQAAEVLAALKAAGEVVSSSSAENADTTNVTRAKRGLMVHFVNVAAISPREVQELHGVAANVADSYRTVLAALQVMAGRGEVRIVGSSLSDTDPRTVNARLTFEAQKSAVDAVEKAFTAAGLEFPSRSVTRAADSVSALDTKVGYQITEIRSAETMDPKRTITVGVEVGDVGKAVRDLRTALSGLESGPGQKVQESDFTVSSDNRGNVIAQIRLDAYVSATPTVMAALGNLGLQKSYQESRNAQAPETKSFTKERVDLTLLSRAPIVQVDQGVGSSVRAALSSAAGALLYSVYLVLTGLLFVLPFVAIGWPVWALMRRRKAKG